MGMYRWTLWGKEEKPVVQDVDDLIFDQQEEWYASDR